MWRLAPAARNSPECGSLPPHNIWSPLRRARDVPGTPAMGRGPCWICISSIVGCSGAFGAGRLAKRWTVSPRIFRRSVTSPPRPSSISVGSPGLAISSIAIAGRQRSIRPSSIGLCRACRQHRPALPRERQLSTHVGSHAAAARPVLDGGVAVRRQRHGTALAHHDHPPTPVPTGQAAARFSGVRHGRGRDPISQERRVGSRRGAAAPRSR
jgi:hypothetical protein